MVKNINRVVISGNMTRDPELRRTQSGMAILTIGVACNDSRKNQQTGEWEDIANFVDCTMFGNRAESIANYLHKGTKVFIEGKLRYSSWEKDGQKRSKLEVLIDEIEFNNPQGQSCQQGGYQQPQQYQQPQMQQGYYAPQPQQYAQPMPQQAPQQPMQQQYAQPAPQQYQQPQTAPQTAPQAAPQPAQQQMQMQQPAADTSVYDDDIPF